MHDVWETFSGGIISESKGEVCIYDERGVFFCASSRWIVSSLPEPYIKNNIFNLALSGLGAHV